jgi:hypothetical protein
MCTEPGSYGSEISTFPMNPTSIFFFSGIVAFALVLACGAGD